jgi:hypothetical protein
MTVLIHDGRRGGHLRWLERALQAGVADGVVISPFHTPRIASPRNPAGGTVAGRVAGMSLEVVFDATTHARLLPGSDDLVHYDTWGLWGPSGVGLDTASRRVEHVELVFQRQLDLSTPFLAPTLTLDQPSGSDADDALATATVARSLQPDAWQSLSGRRSFWRAGSALDAYVGQLAQLRAPVWTITVVNDIVLDNMPDMADGEAFEGLCRTVHSLSLRSRVIVLHADYTGLPAIAAGANTLGSGWDRGQRFLDPLSFQLSSPGIRIAASYVTHGNLAAVLRRDVGDVVATLGPTIADALRGGPLPPNDAAEHHHHLGCLREITDAVDAHRSRADRVKELRHFYAGAGHGYRYLDVSLPRVVPGAVRQRWLDQPHAVLERYAAREGY